MHVERVEKYQAGERIVWFLLKRIHDGSWVDHDAKRPVKVLIDRDKNQLLFENIDILLRCPRLDCFWTFISQCCIKVRGEKVEVCGLFLHVP